MARTGVVYPDSRASSLQYGCVAQFLQPKHGNDLKNEKGNRIIYLSIPTVGPA